MFQPNFHIRFLHQNEGQILRYHFHNELELLIPTTQGGQLWIENSVYPITPGTLFILDEHLLHHQSNPHVPYERYVLHIATEQLEKISSPNTDLLHCLRCAPRVIDIHQDYPRFIAQMDKLCNLNPEEFGYEINRTIDFLSFLLELCRLIHQAPAVNQAEQSSTVARVIEIQKYIQENCTRPLTLDEIAAEFFVSKYHLCHLFKETSKYSVIEFLNYCRVTQACTLLRGQTPPSQVGEAVGFQSGVQFTRVFKQWIGVTPVQYSRKFRKTFYIDHTGVKH